jgi:uncharacterized protein YbaR (Trm112 family)
MIYPMFCPCCKGNLSKLMEYGHVYAKVCSRCRLTFYNPEDERRAPRCPVCHSPALRVDNQGEQQFFVHEQHYKDKEIVASGHHANLGGFVDYLPKL